MNSFSIYVPRIIRCGEGEEGKKMALMNMIKRLRKTLKQPKQSSGQKKNVISKEDEKLKQKEAIRHLQEYLGEQKVKIIKDAIAEREERSESKGEEKNVDEEKRKSKRVVKNDKHNANCSLLKQNKCGNGGVTRNKGKGKAMGGKNTSEGLRKAKTLKPTTHKIITQIANNLNNKTPNQSSFTISPNKSSRASPSKSSRLSLCSQ